MTIHDTVIATLAPLIDPFSGQSLEQLGFAADIVPDESRLTIELTAGFPTHPLKEALLLKINQELSQALPNTLIDTRLDFLFAHTAPNCPGEDCAALKTPSPLHRAKAG